MAFRVAEGEAYLLRVGGYQGAEGQADLMVTCFNDCNFNEHSDAEEVVSGAAQDCNSNVRPDECDVRGDFSDDNEIDLLDLKWWTGCMSGPCANAPCEPPLYEHPCCAWVDLAEDGDVDLRDLSAYQLAFSTSLDLGD
jgi:hypothetical protein